MAKRVKMQIELPARTKRLVDRQVASGAFRDAGEFFQSLLADPTAAILDDEFDRLVAEGKARARGSRPLTPALLADMQSRTDETIRRVAAVPQRSRRHSA